MEKKINLMDKVSNDDVLKKVDEDNSILNGIWKSIHRRSVPYQQLYMQSSQRFGEPATSLLFGKMAS